MVSIYTYYVNPSKKIMSYPVNNHPQLQRDFEKDSIHLSYSLKHNSILSTVSKPHYLTENGYLPNSFSSGMGFETESQSIYSDGDYDSSAIDKTPSPHSGTSSGQHFDTYPSAQSWQHGLSPWSHQSFLDSDSPTHSDGGSITSGPKPSESSPSSSAPNSYLIKHEERWQYPQEVTNAHSQDGQSFTASHSLLPVSHQLKRQRTTPPSTNSLPQEPAGVDGLQSKHDHPSLERLQDSKDSQQSSGKTVNDIDVQDKSLPYAQLIYMALMSVPTKRMVLAEIYNYFRERIPRFRKAKGKGWMNSIRHNLSMNGAFLKEERPPGDIGKGYIWVLSQEAIRDGVKSTTRFRKTPPAKRKASAVEAANTSPTTSSNNVLSSSSISRKRRNKARKWSSNKSQRCKKKESMTVTTGERPCLDEIVPVDDCSYVSKLSSSRDLEPHTNADIAPHTQSCVSNTISNVDLRSSSLLSSESTYSGSQIHFTSETSPPTPRTLQTVELSKDQWPIEMVDDREDGNPLIAIAAYDGEHCDGDEAPFNITSYNSPTCTVTDDTSSLANREQSLGPSTPISPYLFFPPILSPSGFDTSPYPSSAPLCPVPSHFDLTLNPFSTDFYGTYPSSEYDFCGHRHQPGNVIDHGYESENHRAMELEDLEYISTEMIGVDSGDESGFMGEKYLIDIRNEQGDRPEDTFAEQFKLLTNMKGREEGLGETGV